MFSKTISVEISRRGFPYLGMECGMFIFPAYAERHNKITMTPFMSFHILSLFALSWNVVFILDTIVP